MIFTIENSYAVGKERNIGVLDKISSRDHGAFGHGVGVGARGPVFSCVLGVWMGG